jgi:TRAP-type mannitol/chloroaromatic compound transport system permease large subunit
MPDEKKKYYYGNGFSVGNFFLFCCYAFTSLLLSGAYRRLDWPTLKSAVYRTLFISSMILLIVAATFVFTGTFILVGGGDLVQEWLLGLPVGRWGVLAIMACAFFLFGLFMECVRIVPILVPIFAPVLAALHFDPLWAAILFCVVMQTSFLTPPMAPALFYIKGVASQELDFGQHIVRGAIPFIILQVIGVTMIALFPQLALWLPGIMIR